MTTLARSFALGFSTGLRSYTPPAVLSWSSKERRSRLPAPLRWTSRSLIRNGLLLGALIEISTDKLPFIPSRSTPPVVGWRLIVGTAVGAARAERSRTQWVAGAAAGALGAAVGTIGGERARKAVGTLTGLPDQVVASAEDALAMSIALWGVDD